MSERTSYTMTISPDFKPALIPGWYIFNTWLQKSIGEDIHLELVNNFSELGSLIDSDDVDLIYANPFDMSKLIREKSFLPISKPIGKKDEAVIITKADSSIESVESLTNGVRVSITDAPDVNMVGAIMLESADLYNGDFEQINCTNNITIAKNVINGETEIGFMLADSYDELSLLVKKQLKPLIRSKIDLLHHTFLISPNLSDKFSQIQKALLEMSDNSKGKNLLQSLEFENWLAMDNEESEFMIDLIETLQP